MLTCRYARRLEQFWTFNLVESSPVLVQAHDGLIEYCHSFLSESILAKLDQGLVELVWVALVEDLLFLQCLRFLLLFELTMRARQCLTGQLSPWPRQACH